MTEPIAALDNPIERATIDKLPIAVIDQWLESVRARRLTIVLRLEEAKEVKRKAYLHDVKGRYEKQYARCQKSLEALDEKLEMIDRYILKLRTLELELSDG